jgi:phasin family protein
MSIGETKMATKPKAAKVAPPAEAPEAPAPVVFAAAEAPADETPAAVVLVAPVFVAPIPEEAAPAPAVIEPIAVSAEQAPVAVSAERAPVAVTAEQAPVAVTAEQAPVAVTAEQAPVAVTAKQPMEKIVKTAEEFVAFGQGNMEAFAKSGQIWVAGVQDLSGQVAASAQARMEEAMSVFKAIAGMKSLKDMFELQSTFAKAAMEKTMAESGKLSDASMKLAEQAMAPIAARVTMAVETFGKAA